MAIEDLVVVTGATVTEDETSGVQNSGTPVLSGGLVVEDNNDQDVALSGLSTMPFASRLFGSGGLNLSQSGVIGLARSAGNVVSIGAGSGLQDVAFTDANGDPLAGADSGLFTDSGQKIFLYTDFENNIVLGRVGSGGGADPNGAVAFAVVLNETRSGNTVTGADAWIVQFQPLAHNLDGDATSGATATTPGAHDDLLTLAGKLYVSVSQEIVFSDFSKAPSTASDWTGIAATGSSADVQILITGRTPVEENNNQTGDVVQTSNIGVGTNSQSVDPGEGLRIDFVSGLNLPPKLGTGDSKDIDGINYNTHVEASGAAFKLVQVQGNATNRTDAKVSLFNTDDDKGNQFVPSLHDGEAAVNVGLVQVLDANGRVIDSSDGSVDDPNITISISGNSATVGGLLHDYSVLVRSVAGTKFDRMLIENTAPAGQNDGFDVGGVRLLDAVKDVDDLGASIRFEDDGPSVSLALSGAPALTLDESGLAGGPISTSASAASLFATTAAFGADGAAAAGASTWSLLLSGAGVDSGLDDTATGQNVLLYLESGQVVGRAGGASGAEVLRVRIDAATGQLTVSQSRAIVHDDPNDPDEGSSPAVMASGLISARRTVLDGDGDTASAAVSVSQLLKFEDDGPGASLSLHGAPELRLDESDLAGGAISTSASAATLFDVTAAFGQDGPAASGAALYALMLANPGADSGLDDTATGANVLLFLEAGRIVGRAGGPAGAVVFTVAVDAGTGEVTLSQSRAVFHADPGDPDQSAAPATMAAGLFSVRLTATDGDGDSKTSSVSVSQLMKFEDDGPGVSLALNGAPNLTVDESGLTAGPTVSTTVSAASLFTTAADFGQDGAASAGASSWALTLANAGADSGLDDTATGSDVLLFLENNQIVGRAGGPTGAVVFTVAIDASTGAVTLTQARAVVHHDPADPDESASPAAMASGLFGVQRTVVDGDGDHAVAAVSVSQLMHFLDDGPATSLALVGAPALTVDETGLTSAATVSATASAANLFGSSAGFGADGPGSSSWWLTLPTSGADSGLNDSATGQDVLLFLESGRIVGRAGAAGPVVFTVAVDAGTGDVTLTQARAVAHDDPDDPDESAGPAVMAAGLFGVARTVTDGDGDSASASVSLSELMKFEDDGPSVSLAVKAGAELRLDESGLSSGSPITTHGFAADLFVASAAFGADGVAASGASVWGLTLSGAGVDSGLDDVRTGANILLYLESGQIVGRVGGQAGAEAFRVLIDPVTGEVTLSQSLALKHPNPNDADEASAPLSVAANLIGVQRTVTDRDGDHARARVDLGGLLKFEDDGPGAFSPGAGQVQNVAGAVYTEDLDFLAHVGADQAGSIVFTGTNGSALVGSVNGGAAVPLKSGGAPVYLYGFGTGTLTASTDSDASNGLDATKTVFTIVLNPAGDDYTVTMAGKIDNGAKVTFSDFSKAPSTASDWTGIAPTGSSADIQLLITGRTPVEMNNNQTGDVVQTSSIGVGTNSQSVDAGEGLRIDFVSGLNLPPKLGSGDTKDIDGINYNTHVEVTEAAFKLVQVQGSAKNRTDAKITLFNTDDDKGNTFVPSLHLGEVAVTVGVVKVLNAAGQVIDASDGSINDTKIDITISGASATVKGLLAGYSVQVDSAAGLKFDRMLIENVSPDLKGDGFDVGGVVISERDAGSPIDLQFGLRLSDGDGDSVAGSLEVLLTPPTSTSTTLATTAATSSTGSFAPLHVEHGWLL